MTQRIISGPVSAIINFDSFYKGEPGALCGGEREYDPNLPPASLCLFRLGFSSSG